ncbi:MAG: enoyl-CoA hydratase/isomerase family protein [Dehalococcoidia bacterium]
MSLPFEKQGAIARVTFDRPYHQNAIDTTVIVQLHDACEALADDAEVRAVVLTATGDVFSSGWDWEALAGHGDDALEAARYAGMLDDPFGCLAEMSKPVVCAINGDAIGGGLALALACDVRVTAEGTRFAVPETAMGLIPMGGATQRLARLVGRGKAIELTLTGESIRADEALRIGLVSVVTSQDKVIDEAERIAGRIAERGPLAVQYAKEAISRGIDMPLEQALRYETDLTVILQTTEDRAEGVRAFLEKRKPEFKGK